MRHYCNTFDLFDKIRTKTPMYTGGKTLSHLKSFIWGALYSMDSINNIELQGIFINDNFDRWIASKFGFASSVPGWCNLISAIAMGGDVDEINRPGFDWELLGENLTNDINDKSIALFFELFDEYKLAGLGGCIVRDEGLIGHPALKD